MRLILVRHGQVDPRFRGRCYGQTDVPLSPHGLRQAHGLAAQCAGLEPAAIYSSPLRRALETARAIAAPHRLEPIPVPGLAELHFGEFEGREFDEIERSHRELFSRWMKTPTEIRFPNGESYEELAARATGAVSTIRSRHDGETVVVVAHAGVNRAILADALELPAAGVFRLDQHDGALNVIDWIGDTAFVRLVDGTRI